MDEYYDDYYENFDDPYGGYDQGDYSYQADNQDYGDFQDSGYTSYDQDYEYSDYQDYQQPDYSGQEMGPAPQIFQPDYGGDEGWAPEGHPQEHEEADSWAPLGDPQEHEEAPARGMEDERGPRRAGGYPAPGGRSGSGGKDESGSRSRGYGSSVSRSDANVSRVTQPVRPLGTSPVLPPSKPAVPTLTMPARDPARVRQLVQEAAAPAVRGLRDQYRRIMAQHYDNPNVRRMTLREAMSGYGAGLDKVFGQARTQARAQYEQEYSDKATEAKANWQAQVNAENAAYQSAWQDWWRNYGQKSYTDYDSGGFGGYNLSQPVTRFSNGRNTL